MESEEIINNLIEKVKQSKKYKDISDKIIKKEILSYLKSSQIKIKEKPLKKREIKSIVKEIRAKLHRIYASYQTKDRKKRDLYLDELKEILDKLKFEYKNNKIELYNPKEINSDSYNNYDNLLEIINKLLSTNLSTKERLNDYQYIYSEIFSITKNPETITDLGCGLNPLSFLFMKLKNLNYYAYDISNEDINFLNKYFEIMKKFGLKGKTEFLDVTDINEISISKLPKSDIVFMFKLIDLIDSKSKKKKKISEFIINYLLKNKKTNFITASFSTKTLTRKPMNLPRRIGFEKMLLRNNLKFKNFSTDNEIFYVIYN